jgi:uncharacterized membrane protein
MNMKNNPTPYVVLALLCAVYLAFVAGSMLLLPERVAIHFDGAGHANNWTDRSALLILFGGLGVGAPIFFVGSGLLVGLVPDGMVNLPHREYWLAPERRAQTRAYLSGQMAWMGCLALLFLAGIYGLTILANRLTPQRLPMVLFLPLVAGFLAGTIVWTIVLLRHFSMPKAAR